MAESNQRTARAQKALKAQKAQSGAAKAKARQEEEALLRPTPLPTLPRCPAALSPRRSARHSPSRGKLKPKKPRKSPAHGRKAASVDGGPACNPAQTRSPGGMAIVALGVVYGDIGTSPLYTAQTFLAGQGGLGSVDREAVLGMLSLVFWSITLITTVKYVLIAMRIDNNGEGGIFALYSLIRKYGAWLAIPAMLGGAAFLADSVLTPAVSISSAVEACRPCRHWKVVRRKPKPDPDDHRRDHRDSLLRAVARHRKHRQSIRLDGAGLVRLPRIVGVTNLSNDWSVFEALNPVYGIKFLFSPNNAAGIALWAPCSSRPPVRGAVLRHGPRGARQHLLHLAIHQGCAGAQLLRPRRVDAGQ